AGRLPPGAGRDSRVHVDLEDLAILVERGRCVRQRSISETLRDPVEEFVERDVRGREQAEPQALHLSEGLRSGVERGSQERRASHDPDARLADETEGPNAMAGRPNDASSAAARESKSATSS